MSGWIKVHRKIQDSPMYRGLNSKQRDVLFQILLMANHEEKEWLWNGQVYKCKPGQFVTSLTSIQQKCAKDVTIQNIRTALLILEKCHFLTNESTKQNRLITICKWDEYQSQSTNDLTDGQQTTNKRLTTNKKRRSQDVKTDEESLNTLESSLHDNSEVSKQISELIFKFQHVNPSYSLLFKRKDQREAAERLIKTHGYDQVIRLVDNLQTVMQDKYSPQVTTPRQLEEKLGQLILFIKKKGQTHGSRIVSI